MVQRHKPLRAVAPLALVLLVPRIARLVYPQVWIEDESYLNVALALSRGERPYLDVPLQHFPVLDWLLSVAFRVFGASIMTAEVLTLLAAFVSSLLLFRIGRRLASASTGVSAALIFGCSSLLFRYHVFDRELFLLVPVLLATQLVLGADQAKAWSHEDIGGAKLQLGVAALLALAIAFKQTAWSALVAIAIHLWWTRRGREALTIVGATIALIGALTLALFGWAGDQFFVQVILFGWRHAGTPIFSIKIDELRASMDVPLALGVGGIVSLVLARRLRQWLLPMLQVWVAFIVLEDQFYFVPVHAPRFVDSFGCQGCPQLVLRAHARISARGCQDESDLVRLLLRGRK